MPSGKYVNSVGKKYNKLYVLEEIRKSKSIYCVCQCDCGKTKEIKKDAVVRGVTTSCGCINSLVGKRFGKLLVISETDERTKKGRKKYLCQCDCGNIKIVGGDSLNAGTKSCGCLYYQKEYDNLIGKRFEKLLVIEEVEKTKKSQRQFLCQCDCGNTKIILGSNLIYGESTSCGCNRGYVENTKINLLKINEAYSNSKSGIKGVWQDKNGYWNAIITVSGKRIYFYGGIGDEGKDKCVTWRTEMVEKYHKPLIEKYSDL